MHEYRKRSKNRPIGMLSVSIIKTEYSRVSSLLRSRYLVVSWNFKQSLCTAILDKNYSLVCSGVYPWSQTPLEQADDKCIISFRGYYCHLLGGGGGGRISVQTSLTTKFLVIIISSRLSCSLCSSNTLLARSSAWLLRSYTFTRSPW